MIETLDEYQKLAHRTAVYTKGIEAAVGIGGDPQAYLALAYCTLKLCGESGEFGELVGKALRDDNGLLSISRMLSMRKELGDVLWYIAEICTLMGWSMSELAEENIQKLTERQQKGVLHGAGSDR